MNKALSAMLFALMLSSYAFAEPATDMKKPATETSRKLTKQQMRMKDCNREAKEKKLKGDPRRSFMKACLSGKKQP